MQANLVKKTDFDNKLSDLNRKIVSSKTKGLSIAIKKIDDYENILNVSPLYLMILSATGYFTEKNSEKYWILDTIDKYEEVFSGIISEIETINEGEEMYYEKLYAKAGVNTDDDIPLNKKLKFPSLTIIIRCVFQK